MSKMNYFALFIFNQAGMNKFQSNALLITNFGKFVFRFWYIFFMMVSICKARRTRPLKTVNRYFPFPYLPWPKPIINEKQKWDKSSYVIHWCNASFLTIFFCEGCFCKFAFMTSFIDTPYCNSRSNKQLLLLPQPTVVPNS